MELDIDYTDINEFELVWRWNQKSHCLMPHKDLKTIKPISEKSAKMLYLLNPKFSAEILELECKETPIDFLNKNLTNEIVYVFWGPRTAVETTTETLLKYFSDFCYPSSDDVDIWPASKSWLLQYHHCEVLTFAK